MPGAHRPLLRSDPATAGYAHGSRARRRKRPLERSEFPAAQPVDACPPPRGRWGPGLGCAHDAAHLGRVAVGCTEAGIVSCLAGKSLEKAREVGALEPGAASPGVAGRGLASANRIAANADGAGAAIGIAHAAVLAAAGRELRAIGTHAIGMGRAVAVRGAGLTRARIRHDRQPGVGRRAQPGPWQQVRAIDDGTASEGAPLTRVIAGIRPADDDGDGIVARESCSGIGSIQRVSATVSREGGQRRLLVGRAVIAASGRGCRAPERHGQSQGKRRAQGDGVTREHRAPMKSTARANSDFSGPTGVSSATNRTLGSHLAHVSTKAGKVSSARPKLPGARGTCSSSGR